MTQQCSECLEFFENELDVEIWYDEQPFHRDCLKKVAERDVPDHEVENVKEIIDDESVFGIEPAANGLKILRGAGGD